jgi:hypothetical protein
MESDVEFAGLFLSIGSSVATAGPAGALISYALVGLFVFGVGGRIRAKLMSSVLMFWLVMTLGEMSSLIPVRLFIFFFLWPQVLKLVTFGRSAARSRAYQITPQHCFVFTRQTNSTFGDRFVSPVLGATLGCEIIPLCCWTACLIYIDRELLPSSDSVYFD